MTHDEVRTVIGQVLSPSCFFVAPGVGVRTVCNPQDSGPWEIFRGHLLDHTQTRLCKTYESWTVWVDRAGPALDGPIISIQFDPTGRQLHVTRSLLARAWEPADAAGNVVGGREVERRLRELVATVDLATVASPEALRQRLSRAVFLAVVGTSRLPITSVESPLPGFSLGQLGYIAHRSIVNDSRPLDCPRDLIEQALTAELSPLERAKLLETVLRAAALDEVPALAESFVERCGLIGLAVEEIPTLFRTIFNHVALSPYTGFVDNLVAMLRCLPRLTRPARLGPPAVIDVFSYFLRHLARHLTAFDLVTFHNLGANYPDALMLDALLKAYVGMIEPHAREFDDGAGDSHRLRQAKQRRRRALRLGWLLRRQYEGHLVPDAPTSPGENQRVLPPPFVRVPDEQIVQPRKRRRRLFADDPTDGLLTRTARRVLDQSIADLERPGELFELGLASFLDRPLGVFKPAGSVDRTPLVSYEAFSRTIAAGRIESLHRWGVVSQPAQRDRLLRRLAEQPVRGFPVTELAGAERPGVVALEDARNASPDFQFLSTTRRSLQDLCAQYDFEPMRSRVPDSLEWLRSERKVLLIRLSAPPLAGANRPFLAALDRRMRQRIEFALGQPDEAPVRYIESGGIEYLEQGLRVLKVCDAAGCECDFTDADVRLLPRLAAAGTA